MSSVKGQVEVLPRRLLRELGELHPVQRAAAVHDGNVVVVAGPGSGKTRTLVARVAYLLAARVSPFRGAACITYTTAAAEEVGQRIRALGVAPERLVCSTVHSFCLNEILRPFAALTGSSALSPQTVLGDDQAVVLLQECFDTIGILDNAQWRVGAVTSIRRALACGESVDAFDDREVKAAQLYERKLLEEGQVDFEHMVIRALWLVREDAHVRDLLQARFPHVIVDEYQDLGGVLHALVLALRDAGITITVVGDADQTIFGFSGSDPKYLAQLGDASDFVQFTLQVNYRSGQRIIHASEAALGQVRGRLARDGARPGALHLERVKGGLDDHARVAVRLVEQVLSRGVPQERVAILYPSKGVLLDQLLAALVDSALPHVHERDAGLPRGHIVGFLRRCAALAIRNGQDHLEGPDRDGVLQGSRESDLPSVAQLAHEFRLLRLRASVPASSSRLELLRLVQRCVDPAVPVAPLDSADTWLQVVDEHLGIADLAEAHPESRETAAVQDLLALGATLEMQNLALGGVVRGRVVVTTYHSAKGREFHTVVLPGLVEGLVPRDVKTSAGWRAPTGKSLEEQRRAFYVALSRAEQAVHLITGRGYHTANGYWISKGPSCLLEDVLQHVGP